MLITSVLNSASDSLAISSSLSCIFCMNFYLFFYLGHLFLSRHAYYAVRGGTLGIFQGGAIHITVLWCCMWVRGLRGNNAACSALCQLSVTFPTTHKQIGSIWCWFSVPCVCVFSSTLCLSPMKSPMRLGVSLTAAIPEDFTARRFEALFPRAGTLGCAVYLLPSCSSQFICMHMWDRPVCQYPPCCTSPPTATLPCVPSTLAAHLCPLLPVSAPPTSLKECFFFNSLVVWLPYSSILWQLWLFFVLKFAVVLLLVVQIGKVYLCLHLGWKSICVNF